MYMCILHSFNYYLPDFVTAICLGHLWFLVFGYLFSKHKSYIYFVKYIPRNFILFGTVVKGIVSGIVNIFLIVYCVCCAKSLSHV